MFHSAWLKESGGYSNSIAEREKGLKTRGLLANPIRDFSKNGIQSGRWNRRREKSFKNTWISSKSVSLKMEKNLGGRIEGEQF